MNCLRCDDEVVLLQVRIIRIRMSSSGVKRHRCAGFSTLWDHFYKMISSSISSRSGMPSMPTSGISVKQAGFFQGIDVDGRDDKAAFLVEMQGMQVVIGGDEPQSLAALPSGRRV